MSPHPLAILLVFRNDRKLAEESLISVFNRLKGNYELYVVDDASDDDTADVIREVLTRYDFQNAFFYENPTPIGRGRSIRELLQLIETPLLWMPEHVVDSYADLEQIPSFLSTGATSASDVTAHQNSSTSTQSDSDDSATSQIAYNDSDGSAYEAETPADVTAEAIAEKWIKAFAADSDTAQDPAATCVQNIPSDSNLDIKESEKSVFQEKTDTIQKSTGIILDDDYDGPDFDGVVGEVRPMGTSGRPAVPSDSKPKPVKEPIKFRPNLRRNSIELPENASHAAIVAFDEIQKFVHEGENLLALKAIESAQLSHPSDVGLLHLKIKVLEFMRRYVEAAELKHQLRMGGPGASKPKIRREAILIVDPTEDVEGTAIVDKQRPKEIMDVAVVNATHDASIDSGTDETDVDVSESDVIADTDSTSESVETPEVEDDTQTVLSPEEDAKSTTPKQEAPSPQHPSSYSKKPRISVIIPTAIDGKVMLERAVYSLSLHADKEDRELIVIDNASLDDTYEYLNQLKQQNFMQIRVITNSSNAGFGRAVNQGIHEARGKYLLVMHNDVNLDADIPGKMADLMDQNPDVTTLGPMTEVTWNDDQRIRETDSAETELHRVRFIDSFFMMVRKESARSFDERYGLAHFDDMDYCLEDAKQGGVIAVATGLRVGHLGGATTSVIGRDSSSRSYWRNAAEFEKKWDALPPVPDFTDVAPIDRLCKISELLNPYYPEKHILDIARLMIDSELKNEILERNYPVQKQIALIKLMIALDMRDISRVLEDSLDDNDFDQALIQLLIDFYFNRNIYSRCHKYLNKNSLEEKSFEIKLLELKVLMGARDFEKSTELLSELISVMPAHPELFKITSDIHRLQGNRAESEEFYALAHQTDPYMFR